MSQALAYLLLEDGELYALREIEKESTVVEAWERFSSVGRYRSIAVDGGLLYGVTQDLEVEFQWLDKASRHGWACLSKGLVIGVTAHRGILYAVGGDTWCGEVQTMEHKNQQNLRANWYTNWRPGCPGKCYSVATDGSLLYAVGPEDWVYQQPLQNFAKDSEWVKAFPAGGVRSAFGILRGGAAIGIRNGQLWRRDPAAGTWVQDPAAADLPSPAMALAVVPCATAEEFANPTLWAAPPSPKHGPVGSGPGSSSKPFRWPADEYAPADGAQQGPAEPKCYGPIPENVELKDSDDENDKDKAGAEGEDAAKTEEARAPVADDGRGLPTPARASPEQQERSNAAPQDEEEAGRSGDEAELNRAAEMQTGPWARWRGPTAAGKEPKDQEKADEDDGTPFHEGTLVVYYEDRGYGYIVCDTHPAKWFYINKAVVESKRLSVGSLCKFKVRLSLRLKPQAFDITAVIREPPFEGKILSAMCQDGFGVISCPDTFTVYGEHVRIRAAELVEKGLEFGRKCRFHVEETEVGRPLAVNLEPLPVEERPGVDSGMGTLEGVVQTMWEDWYGFITCKETFQMYGEDLFMHHSEFKEGMEVGSPVTFKISLNHKGKPQAVNVQLKADGLSPDSPAEDELAPMDKELRLRVLNLCDVDRDGKLNMKEMLGLVKALNLGDFGGKGGKGGKGGGKGGSRMAAAEAAGATEATREEAREAAKRERAMAGRWTNSWTTMCLNANVPISGAVSFSIVLDFYRRVPDFRWKTAYKRLGGQVPAYHRDQQAGRRPRGFAIHSAHGMQRRPYQQAAARVGASEAKQQSRALVVGGRAEACARVLAAADGYLDVQVGDKFIVEYIGSASTEDAGWLYGSLDDGRRGWLTAQAVRT